MNKTIKDAALNCKIINSVIDAYRLVQDRVNKLDELGYEIRQQWVGTGGVGTVRSYHGKKGVQISSTTASCKNVFVGLAFVAYPSDNSLAELPAGIKTWLWLKKQQNG